MTVVLVVGAIAVVVAIVVGATWHRSADERQSVKNYQHTLETLRLVSDRNAGRHLNVTASSEGASQDLSESEALIGRSGARHRPGARSVWLREGKRAVARPSCSGTTQVVACRARPPRRSPSWHRADPCTGRGDRLMQASPCDPDAGAS